MKTLFLVLLVCVASAYAANPITDALNNVQGLVNTLIQQLINSVFQLPIKPRADLSAILGAFNGLLQSVGQNFVQQISNILFGLTTTILNPLGGGKSVEAVKQEAAVKIQDQVNELLGHLTGLITSLAQNLFGNLIGKRDIGSILSSFGINLNQLGQQLQSQLLGVLLNLINGLTTRSNRGIIDWISEAFGLGAIVNQLQSVGSALYGQFLSLATQLLFAGQQMWQQAIPVFNNLVAELTSHAGNAVQLVSQAVLQLTSVLSNGSRVALQRGVVEFLLQNLGLGAVWSQLQSVGTALYSQFLALATQLLFAGQQMWQQAIPVFQNLVAEMTSHAGNAVQLVSQAVLQLTSVLANGSRSELQAKGIIDWISEAFGFGAILSQLQSVGSALYNQFVAVATQLLFAGQQMWQQAIPVFQNLVAEMTSHAGNAVQLVSQAVLQLTSVLANGN